MHKSIGSPRGEGPVAGFVDSGSPMFPCNPHTTP